MWNFVKNKPASIFQKQFYDKSGSFMARLKNGRFFLCRQQILSAETLMSSSTPPSTVVAAKSRAVENNDLIGTSSRKSVRRDKKMALMTELFGKSNLESSSAMAANDEAGYFSDA